MHSRLLLYLTAVAFCLPSAWAQNASARWDNLSQVKHGQRLHVVEITLKSTTGKFVSFTDSELVLQVDNGQVTIAREKVFRVTEDHRRGRNALIAGLVGAGIGAGIGSVASRVMHDGDEKAGVVMASVGAWAGVCAGISALATRSPTVYRAEKVPIVTADAKRQP